ncbi:methyltransferase domain-containing protein [Colletotrichum phormii]|uniref:Methyltransferase domain-containing protein n=1 Tax=Colletotrichum phormii TaxID=359342 RepID=A0AAI9ZEA8_9PEZI|nr:methyltransferase domain-containing protein [Colletotrichum phormii]KAK1622000.1 methyltransferase domain-containing protein [Colletotrichum phormii]
MATPTAESAGPMAPTFRSMDKTIGAHWEKTMIEMSRTMMVPLNARLLAQMGLGQHTTEPIAFLDSACGAGPATQELFKAVPREVLEKSEVVCADGSPMMAELVERRIREEGWVGARARVSDAMDSGLAENSLTHVVIGLGLLIPRPDKTTKDVVRILEPGGVFGCITPHVNHIGWVADVMSAFASFPFHAPFEEMNRAQVHDVGRWYDEAWVRGYLQENGFEDVKTCLESGTVRVRDARHWLDVFGPVIALIVSTEWSIEVREEHGLEEVRGLIGEHLEGKYGGKGWDVGFACIVASGVVVK